MTSGAGRGSGTIALKAFEAAVLGFKPNKENSPFLSFGFPASKAGKPNDKKGTNIIWHATQDGAPAYALLRLEESLLGYYRIVPPGLRFGSLRSRTCLSRL